jgi:hypothetical protein
MFLFKNTWRIGKNEIKNKEMIKYKMKVEEMKINKETRDKDREYVL